jgi:hypothetical protein
MSLEIVRRLRAHGLAGEDFDTRITGVVGLFPTVVDIARSESGLKASVSLCISLTCDKTGAIANFVKFTAVSQKFKLCAHRIADCWIHHHVDASGIAI